MYSFSTVGSANCRRYVAPSCEPDIQYSQSSSIEAVELFQLRQRDQLDFGIDFSAWLAGNGGSTITNAVWSVAAGSPHAPVIVGQAFDAAGEAVVVLATHAGALPGDAYWMDIVVDLSATTVAPVLPARQITRRVHVVVVQG